MIISICIDLFHKYGLLLLRISRWGPEAPWAPLAGVLMTARFSFLLINEVGGKDSEGMGLGIVLAPKTRTLWERTVVVNVTKATAASPT